MNWRIRPNGPAHACEYIRVGWGLLRRGPRGSQPPGKGPMRWSILGNAPIHFGECADPFYRMRLSILANVFFLMFYIIIIILLCYYYDKIYAENLMLPKCQI